MADISKEELRKEIAAILQDADLNSMSTKRVRTLLEEQLEIDLTERKKEVDILVMQCLKDIKSPKSGNGVKKGGDDDDDEEEEDEEEEEEEVEKKPKARRIPPPAKKPAAKRSKKAASDSDEASADEDGASDDDYSPAKKSKATPKKKAGKKKGKAGSDDDGDDGEWKSESRKKGGAKGGKKKGGTNTGYTRAYTLTPELAGVVGQDAMARHEVVKKVWAIIKERNLYDPKNKQFAICDDELFKVFGVKRFRTFGMMKYLKTHFISE